MEWEGALPTVFNVTDATVPLMETTDSTDASDCQTRRIILKTKTAQHNNKGICSFLRGQQGAMAIDHPLGFYRVYCFSFFGFVHCVLMLFILLHLMSLDLFCCVVFVVFIKSILLMMLCSVRYLGFLRVFI